MVFATPDESILYELGKNSFLSLWSYANLYRDQGDCARNGDGKELCDFVVIFGSTVLLFSDKRIEFQKGVAEDVAWRRWHKKAVLGSIKQLKGAERWIRAYPDRIYVDKRCENNFPVPLQGELHVHRIVVTHGLEEELESNNNEPSFSHITKDPQNFDILCNVADDMCHVFTGDSLMFVLSQIDTTADFVDYLEKREAAFTGNHQLFVSKESDLVHTYFKSGEDKETTLLAELSNRKENTYVDYPGIADLLNDPIYMQKKRDDNPSYFWDDLIEHISFHVIRGSTERSNFESIEDNEILMRRMAELPRFTRRRFTQAFWEAWYKVEPGTRGTRMLYDLNSKVAFLFVIIPHESFDSDESYKEFRSTLLAQSIQVYGLENKELEEIVGIAVKARSATDEISPDNYKQLFNSGIDFCWIDNTGWKEDYIEHVKLIRDDLIKKGLLKPRNEKSFFHTRSHEFKES